VSTVVSKPVTISPKPVANFGVPESCLNDPFSQFTDSSTISDGSQAGFTYLWNFGDANASAGNPNTSAVKNPQHQYTAAGPYTVTLTVTSNNGCSNTVSKPFFINGGTPVPMFTVQGGSTSICSGNGITLLDNSSVNPGSVVKLEIYWDYTNDPTIKTVDDDPLAGKAYSHSYPAFGAPATRTVTVRYVAYSGQTCLQYIDQVVTLNATPAITFNAIPGICQDVPSFQITQASVANGLPGSGTFSGPGVSPTGFFDPNAAGSGLKTIRYTYTSSAGCSNFMDQTVDVYPVPVANAGPDKVVLEGGYVVLTPALNTGFPVTYLWTPATGLDNPNSPTPRASPANDITYTLIVTSDKGCSSSDQVFVKQLKAPIIPNIFSPNGDGSHDKWVVAYLDSYPGCTVDIYNRYGQLIYHSLGYTNPWDGKINGKDAPVGTYYYIIDPKNGRSKMTGYVDLIR
jgi:gliding motility-associated-like protein